MTSKNTQNMQNTKNTNNVKKKQEPSSTGKTDLKDSCFSKSVCSSMDCTGLIPALPSSEAELEAYEEMYQFCLDDAADHS